MIRKTYMKQQKMGFELKEETVDPATNLPEISSPLLCIWGRKARKKEREKWQENWSINETEGEKRQREWVDDEKSEECVKGRLFNGSSPRLSLSLSQTNQLWLTLAPSPTNSSLLTSPKRRRSEFPIFMTSQNLWKRKDKIFKKMKKKIKSLL